MSDNPSVYLKVAPANEEDSDELRQIYEEAFPPEERRPWSDFFHDEPLEDDPEVEHATPRIMSIHVSYDHHSWALAGLFTFWQFRSFLYVEHFAIASVFRGHGIGGAVFQALGVHMPAQKGVPTVLEVEPASPEKPETMQRIDFYRGYGLEVVDTGYVQPPYTPEQPPVEMWLMSSSTELDPAEITRLLYKHVYKF